MLILLRQYNETNVASESSKYEKCTILIFRNILIAAVIAKRSLIQLSVPHHHLRESFAASSDQSQLAAAVRHVMATAECNY